ncbi:MAG: gliding motility-associated C-terminal domain-containing protein [Flavobacteriales bacterium]|nr:gliding motility-associated C-terminal domain-containing protein [Flavobacteriales bacterium]
MKQSSFKFLFALFFTLIYSNSLYCNINDTPCNADTTLPVIPFGCNNPMQTTGYSFDNLTANWENVGTQFTGCKGGTFTTPVADVWFRVIPTQKNLILNLTQGMFGPYLGQARYTIYQYNGNCNSLVPIQCKIGTTSNLSDTIFGLIPLTKYYIQVAGKDINDKGNFQISLSSYDFCTSCILHTSMDVKPGSGMGNYPPDTEVQFCISVVGYNPASPNQLHGLSLNFGNGWDMNTFSNLTLPYSVSGTGAWDFYPSITIHGTNHKGYFFEPYFSKNGDPSDNIGDQGNNTSIWIFCFKIKTKADNTCNQTNNNLNVFATWHNDAETGSNFPNNNFCPAEGNKLSFFAVRNCCGAPQQLNVTKTSCKGLCDAKVQLTQIGNNATFTLKDANNNMIGSPQFGQSCLFQNLCANKYTLFIDAIACTNTLSFEVLENDSILALQNVFGCVGEEKNEASALPLYPQLLNRAPYLYEWESLPLFPSYFLAYNPSNTAANMPGGVYNVRVKDKNGCVAEKEIIIFDKPKDNAILSYSNTVFCTNSAAATPTFSPSGGSFTSSPNGLNLNSSTGEIIFSSSTPNTYFITYNTESNANKCGDTASFKITIQPPPSTPTLSKNTLEYCINTFADTIFAFNNPPGTTVVWLDQNLNIVATGLFYIPSFTNTGQVTIYVVSYDPITGCYSNPTTLTVTIKNGGNIDAGENQTICFGHTALLEAKGSASEILWQPGKGLSDSTAFNTIASPENTIMYYAYAKSNDGCNGIDSVLITVVTKPECDLKIYSGFTPNIDGKNDTWLIDGIRLYPDNNVKIFNRWGTNVYAVKNYDNQLNVWKGKNNEGNILPTGTYYYIVDIGTKKYKGWVELTR